jgi:hypothetical protein
MIKNGDEAQASGSCLCGAVRFTIRGAMREVLYCHCAMCRRASSHYAAYTACSVDALDIADSRSLKWYKSSPMARRGFCKKCGSQLFWENVGQAHISVSAGSLDQPTGLRAGEHIFVEHDPDYERGAESRPPATN